MTSQTQSSGKKRGLRWWAVRIIVVGLVLLLLPLLVGIPWQIAASRSESQNNPPPGELVVVNGREMHLYCTGEGGPTVILEGGVPEWSIHWQAVQSQIAQFTRVCAYDRAGYGWSEPGPEPRTAQAIVDELHTLLTNAGETGPYVLVAHSFWGPAALLYQHTYPDDVTGMVLIEAWSPELFSPTPEVITQSLPLAKMLQTIAPLGQVRFVGETGLMPLAEMLQTDQLPAEWQPAYKAAYYGGNFWRTMAAEYGVMAESAAQVQNLGSLGDLPLVVIKAGIRATDDYPPDDVWSETQARLAELSSQGELILAETSGHFIQLEQPELVVTAVRQVVEGSE